MGMVPKEEEEVHDISEIVCKRMGLEIYEFTGQL